MNARSKYSAVRTEVDGISFASKKEARRFAELKLLEKAGHIRGLTLQPRFQLEVMQSKSTTFVSIGEYRADFSYIEERDHAIVQVIEDVKGFRTDLYKWKKKHVEAQYGIEIREI